MNTNMTNFSMFTTLIETQLSGEYTQTLEETLNDPLFKMFCEDMEKEENDVQ